MRGLAILGILIFHAVPEWLPGGFVGVDLFFVISGYLMTIILQRETGVARPVRESILLFYQRRARRILPALLVLLVTCLIAFPWVLTSGEYRSLAAQSAFSALLVGNFSAWMTSGYFDIESAYKPVIHLWSLGVEEQFYVLYPLLFIAVRGRRARLLHVLPGLALLSWLACIYLTEHAPMAAFYLPVTRFWELLTGGIIAVISQSRHDAARHVIRRCNAASWLFLLLIIISFFLATETGFPGGQGLFPVLGAAGLILAGMDAQANRHVLASVILVRLGRISYSAYLWHWPLLVFGRYYFGGNPAPEITTMLVCLALLAATLSTEYIEKPFRTGQYASGRPVVALAWATLALSGASFALAAGMGSNDAWKAAAEKRVEQAARAATPPGDYWRSSLRCYLDRDVRDQFGKECDGNPGTHPNRALLWGDSHAASIWPGLEVAAQASGWQLAQYTTSCCAPLLSSGRGCNAACPAARKMATERMGELKPQLVILGARWWLYQESLTLEVFRKTADFLKAQGAERIVVIGPLPVWNPSLPSAILHSMDVRNLGEIPEYMGNRLSRHDLSMDTIVKRLAEASGMEYFSPASSLCNDEMGKLQCRVLVEKGGTALMSFDNGHLSPQGSSLLARLARPTVFP